MGNGVGEKLRLARESRRPTISRQELATLLDVTANVIKNYENGFTEPPKPKLLELSRAWEIPLSWFYDENDPQVPGIKPLRVREVSQPYAPSAAGSGKIPHWGKVPAGDFDRPTDDCGSTEVPAQFGNPERYVTFAVVNDSMEPTYQPGEVIIVELTKRPTFGRAVVAHWEGGLCFKRLKMTKEGARLVPDNPIYETLEPREGMEYLGEVVFKMTDQNL